MKRSSLAILIAMLCVASAAMATTYVRVEKDGTKTYSDRPIPGGHPIELQSAQSYSAPSPSNSNSSLPRDREVDEFRYGSCTVTPQNDSTFTNPEELNIVLTTTPFVRPYDTVILTVDGQAIGPPGATSYRMLQASRGTHAVVATVKNQAGEVICTASSSFHVMRPSINLPGRQGGARPAPH